MVNSPIITTSQRRESYFVEVTVNVSDPTEANSIPITLPCVVDTGFSGGISFPIGLEAAARSVGARLFQAPTVTASGARVASNVCLGKLAKIDAHSFPANSILCVVKFMGTLPFGAIGLNLLNRWISEFHGPNSVLTISQ